MEGKCCLCSAGNEILRHTQRKIDCLLFQLWLWTRHYQEKLIFLTGPVWRAKLGNWQQKKAFLWNLLGHRTLAAPLLPFIFWILSEVGRFKIKKKKQPFMQSLIKPCQLMVLTMSVHKDCKDGVCKTEHLRARNYPENTSESPILILVDRHSHQGRMAHKWGPHWQPATGVGPRRARQAHPQNEHSKT